MRPPSTQGTSSVLDPSGPFAPQTNSTSILCSQIRRSPPPSCCRPAPPPTPSPTQPSRTPRPPTCRPPPTRLGTGRTTRRAPRSHLSLGRATVSAHTGASFPSSPRNARSKPPPTRPCRYSSGIRWITSRVPWTNSGSCLLSNCPSVLRALGLFNRIVPEESVSFRVLA